MQEIPLKKLTVVQIVTKFTTSYRTQRFVTMFGRAHHLYLSWVRWIHFTHSDYFFKTHFNIILLSMLGSLPYKFS